MVLGDGSGGGSGSLFNDDQAAETIEDSFLTNRDGTRINWQTVVSVASGIFSVAFFQGLAEFIRGLFETYLINPIQAANGVLTLILDGLWGLAPAVIRGSFDGAARWVEGLGPFAFIGALGIVVLTAFVVARGLNRG
jgi:hypothetical protein